MMSPLILLLYGPLSGDSSPCRLFSLNKMYCKSSFLEDPPFRGDVVYGCFLCTLIIQINVPVVYRVTLFYVLYYFLVKKVEFEDKTVQ